MDSKISIIIVAFNAAKTLETSIQSILQQSYSNKELIVIDGGSTDGTLEILEKINQKGFFWISEPDKGIYDAMNKGIKKATGEWIFFLGADDYFYDNLVLEAVFTIPDIENIDFIYGNIKSDSYTGFYDGEFNFEKLLKKNISHQSIFYRKNIFDKTGFYNLKYKTHSDWDFNLRCYENEVINTKYVDLTIAVFGKGGVSSTYDLAFLRESLFPRKIEFLKTNKLILKDIKNYDEWWRFIRNAGFRTQNDFFEAGYNQDIPDVILAMVKWQNKIPNSFLRMGIISKTIMFISYLFNYYKIRR